MSRLITFLSVLSLLLDYQTTLYAQESSSFSTEQIFKDLDYLTESLHEAHYNLYAYTDKTDFYSNVEIVRNSIDQDSLSITESVSLFQKVISKANTGHAEIDFPVQGYIGYAQNDGTLFPLEIAIEDGRYFVRKNFSQNKRIEIGSEIVSINSQPIEELIKAMYPQLSAETVYFKNAKLEFWSFPRLYWQVFGEQKQFIIEVKQAEKTQKYTLDAVGVIDGYETRRSEILTSKPEIKILNNAAYINPGNFSGDEDIFRDFIDSAFFAISKSKKKNLIVDLRNNAGGNNSFSDYLVSYFAAKPFKWYSKFTLKSSALLKHQTRLNNDTTDSYFRSILEHDDGEIYDYTFEAYQPQPLKKRFRGEVFVLINRHSYSQSAVTAGLIQDYKFGTIVGEETGDFPTLHASQFQFSLPETGIVVKVPKGYIIRVNESEKQRGVIPDIKIRDHLVDEEDEILSALLEQFR